MVLRQSAIEFIVFPIDAPCCAAGMTAGWDETKWNPSFSRIQSAAPKTLGLRYASSQPTG